MENNQNQNPKILSLSALCLKPAFEAIANDLLLGQDKSIVKSLVRILWKKADHVIPIAYGEDGARAIQLMRMIACLEDDEFNITVLGNRWFWIDKSDRDRPKVFDILESFGLLCKSNDWSGWIDSNDGEWMTGKIRLYSLTLLDVIREDNQDHGLKKMILKECVQTSDLEENPNHYKTVWSSMFHSNWNDFILDYHFIGTFYQRFLYENNIDQSDKILFDQTLAKYEELYGTTHELTIELKAIEMCTIFLRQDLSLEEKWNAWCTNLRSHFYIFLEIPTVELYEGKRWENLFYLFESIENHLLYDGYEEATISEEAFLDDLGLLHDITSELRNTFSANTFRHDLGFRHKLVSWLTIPREDLSNGIRTTLTMFRVDFMERQGQGRDFRGLNLNHANLRSWICLLGQILDANALDKFEGDEKVLVLGEMFRIVSSTKDFFDYMCPDFEDDTHCFLPEITLIFVRTCLAVGFHLQDTLELNTVALDIATMTRLDRENLANNHITKDRERMREINNKIEEIVVEMNNQVLHSYKILSGTIP